MVLINRKNPSGLPAGTILQGNHTSLIMLPKFLLSVPSDGDVDFLIHTEHPAFLAQVERDEDDTPYITPDSVVRWFDEKPNTPLVALFEEAVEFLAEEYDTIPDDDDWDS